MKDLVSRTFILRIYDLRALYVDLLAKQPKCMLIRAKEKVGKVGRLIDLWGELLLLRQRKKEGAYRVSEMRDRKKEN